jgi:23S rRNA pseudouridine955/2504/2580 synthase
MMLDALRFGSVERPRLVHRLDRDTSGVLVLARGATAAARLAAAFRGRTVRKPYWALFAGRPRRDEGRIDLALAKSKGARGERMDADGEGKKAETHYRVIDALGRRAAWLALMPRTGRTHQIRAHCAALGVPIVGDGKYGGRAAFLGGEGIADRLHLHARAIEIPRGGGPALRVVAPLTGHMLATWRLLGFDPDADLDPWIDGE